MVERITGFVDLEKLFLVETARGRFVGLEIEEMDDEQSLLALKDAVTASTAHCQRTSYVEKLVDLVQNLLIRIISQDGLVETAW